MSFLSVILALQIDAGNRVLIPVICNHCDLPVFRLHSRQKSAGGMIGPYAFAVRALETGTTDFAAVETFEPHSGLGDLVHIAHYLLAGLIPENEGLFSVQGTSTVGVRPAILSREKVFVV